MVIYVHWASTDVGARTFHHQEKAGMMPFKRLLLAVCTVAALAIPVSSAAAAAPGSESASTAESSQVFSLGSSTQQVTIIHGALLDAIYFEGEYVGTCLVKFLGSRLQQNCHGKLVAGLPPAHLENLSSEGVKIVITPSGNITVEITR